MDISSDNDLCMYHVCIMIMEIFHLYIYNDSFQSNFRLLI